MLAGILMRALDMGLRTTRNGQTCDFGMVLRLRGVERCSADWGGSAPLGSFLRGALEVVDRLCDEISVSEDVGC